MSSSAETVTSYLPFFTIIVPMLGSIAIFQIGQYSEKVRNWLAVVISMITFAMVAAHFPLLQEGSVVYKIPLFLDFGLNFRVDFLSFVFAALISFVWMMATIYSVVYMSYEHARNRFYLFLIFTLGSALGVVMTGDLFSLFVFFELMTFSSYVLVVHEEDEESMLAGLVYIYLGVIGGLSLLMGIFLTYTSTNGLLEIEPMLDQFTVSDPYLITIYVLFVIGFGVKAGMVPLHIWLPKAHPVAPSPASALLSGIMIKAGAYGILRVTLIIFTSGSTDAGFMLSPTIASYFGLVLIWMAILTMFLGAAMALLQTNSKRILAYSSISQMGYILLGIGAAGFLGYQGAMGFTGAIYHIINHAFFKAGLFLMVGAIYIHTHELDFKYVRGMGKKFPFITVMFIIAALGIGGIPGFNGFSSKTLVHDSLYEAYKHTGWQSLYYAEKIFKVTSAMTICYFLKLFNGLFLGPVPEKFDKDYKTSPLVKFVLGSFGAIIILIGIYPNFLLERLVIPATAGFAYDPKYIESYLQGFEFFTPYAAQSTFQLLGVVVAVLVVIKVTKYFEWQPPAWMSIENAIFRPCAVGFVGLCTKMGLAFDTSVNDAYSKTGKVVTDACRSVGRFDQSLDNSYSDMAKSVHELAEKTTRFDEVINNSYENTGKNVRNIAEYTTKFDKVINDSYENTGSNFKRMAEHTHKFDEAAATDEKKVYYIFGRFKWDPDEFNIKNLNFDSFLLAVVLAVFLGVMIYFTTIF